MKNITVSVDDEVHHRARLRAAELNTSVSALVRDFLIDLAENESEAARHRRLQNSLLEKLDQAGKGIVVSDRLDRDAIHQRC